MAAHVLGGAELDGLRVSFSSIRKCDFSGKVHNNISMGDSAKVALLASGIALIHRTTRSALHVSGGDGIVNAALWRPRRRMATDVKGETL